MEIMNVHTLLGRQGESIVIGGVGSNIVFCFSDGRVEHMYKPTRGSQLIET